MHLISRNLGAIRPRALDVSISNVLELTKSSRSSTFLVNHGRFHRIAGSLSQADGQNTQLQRRPHLPSSVAVVNMNVENVAAIRHAMKNVLAMSATSSSSGGSSFSSSSQVGSSDKGKEGPSPSASAGLSPQKSSSSLPLPSTPPQKSRKRVTKFIFTKFLGFVQGYNKVLEKNFPGAMNVYRVFVVGVKDFASELSDYVKISSKTLLTKNGVRDLSSSELDIYYRMPKEIWRVAPTLLISALPFMNYIMFPIAYYFPKRLLSSHFWSLQQRSQFAIDLQKKRLINYRPVFRSLQANSALIRDPILLAKCKSLLDKLGSGSHPSSREIIEIKPLFESDPFSLKAIYGPHVKGLCRMHGIHTLYFNRRRLYDRAEMLYLMDMAMIRDGIFNLKTDDLKIACFIRGLNASNTNHEDMMEYLQQWASISTSIGPHSYSLLLHLPILLAYNNSNNWALLA